MLFNLKIIMDRLYGWEVNVELVNNPCKCKGYSVLWSEIFSFGSVSVDAIRRISAYRYVRSFNQTHKATRKVLRSFAEIPRIQTLTADSIVYRYWDGVNAGQLGRFLTTQLYDYLIYR